MAVPEVMYMNYRLTVNSLDTNSLTKDAPMNGILWAVTFYFPSGANSLVEAFIYHSGGKVMPDSREGITLGGGVPITFRMSEKVSNGDDVELTLENHDDTNDHTIVAILSYMEEIEEEAPPPPAPKPEVCIGPPPGGS